MQTERARPPHVLVVDDSSVDRELIRRMLAPDYAVLEASTSREGLEVCGARHVDCVLLDYLLPDEDGISLLSKLIERELPVVMLTGAGSEAIAVEAMKIGALDYLVKSALARISLRRAVENAVEKAELRRRLAGQEMALHAYVHALNEKHATLEQSNKKLSQSEARLRTLLAQNPSSGVDHGQGPPGHVGLGRGNAADERARPREPVRDRRGSRTGARSGSGRQAGHVSDLARRARLRQSRGATSE